MSNAAGSRQVSASSAVLGGTTSSIGVSTPTPTLTTASDPVGLARIQILLVPVGNVSPTTWAKWTGLIRKFAEIKLSDVPGTSGASSSKSGKTRFLPPSFPSPRTHLHLAFPEEPPGLDILPLSLLQISAFPLAVIGITDLSNDDPTSRLTEGSSTLRSQASSASTASSLYSGSHSRTTSSAAGDKPWTHDQRVQEFHRVLVELGLNNANGLVFPLTRRCFGVEEPDPELHHVDKTDSLAPAVDEDNMPTPRPGAGFQRTSSFPGRTTSTAPTSDSSESARQQRVKESDLLSGMVEIDASDGGSSSRPTTPGGTRFDKRAYEEKLVSVPKDGNVELVLGMLIADVVASVLTELGEIAAALETTTGIQTLNASPLPTLTQRSIPRPERSNDRARGGPSSSATHQSRLSVTTNAGPIRSTSPMPYSLSQSSLPLSSVQEHSVDAPARPASSMSHKSYTEAPRTRPISVLVSSDGKALTNTPPPGSIYENKIGEGSSTSSKMKRSSTGFSFGRVLSGKSLELSTPSPVEVVNVSSPTSGPTGISSTSSFTGRLKKVQADLWLLSGRLEEAINSYQESVTALRNVDDSLWLGSASEGVATAMLLEAWEARDGTDYTVPFLSSPILSDIHDHYTNASTRYSKTSRPPDSLFPHGAESSERIMARLYTTCAMRHSRVLLMTWAAGGWGNNALVSLVTSRLPRLYPPMSYKFRRRVFLKLTTMSRVTRAFVGKIILRAHGPWLQHLSARHHLHVLGHMVACIRLLGQDRRDAFLLAEMAGFALEQSPGRPALDRRESISSQSSFSSLNAQTITDVPKYLSDLLDCLSAYNLDPTVVAEQVVFNLLQRRVEATGFDLGERNTIDTSLYDSHRLSRYGWIQLQIDSIKQLVDAADVLSSFHIMCSVSSTVLRNLHAFMTSTGHSYFHQAYLRSLHSARRAGIDLGDDHCWLPDGMLLSAGLLPLSMNKVPYPVSGTASLTVPTGPFLYNPRDSIVRKQKLLVIEQEQLEFPFTLRNPFGFDLALQSVQLCVTGVSIEASPRQVLLPAYGTETVVLAAIPTGTGELQINGCEVSLADGSKRRFNLEDAETESPRDRRRSEGKVIRKPIGLDARPSVQQSIEAVSPVARPLVLTVAPEQPLLSVRNAVFSSSPVRLFEGEKTEIQFKLYNGSHIPVDHLDITFESTSVGSSSVWSGEYKEVAPGASEGVTITCTGQLGMETETILVSFGRKETGFVRRLRVPVTFAVYPTVVCQSLIISELPAPGRMETLKASILEQLPTDADSEERSGVGDVLETTVPSCLVQLTLSNVTQQDLDVRLALKASQGSSAASLKRRIGASSAQTLFVTLPQIYLDLPSATQGIEFEEAAAAYRSYLFSSLEASWYRSQDGRTGPVSLNRPDVAVEGLQYCRLDPVQVNLSAASGTCAGDPVKLELSWAFQSVSPFAIRYRLDPVSLDESNDTDDSRAVETALRNTIIEGRPWGLWMPTQGEPRIDLPCCFLARGVYYFRATIFAQDAPPGWQKRSWQSNVLEVEVA